MTFHIHIFLDIDCTNDSVTKRGQENENNPIIIPMNVLKELESPCQAHI